MTAPGLTVRRIVVSAGSFAEAKAALRIVEHLAGSLTSDISGLMLEEPDLPRLIELPGQRVVTDSGQIVKAPSRDRLNAILKSDMKRFRQELSHLAELRKARWSFQHLREELVAGSCQAAAVGDVVIFGCRLRSVRRDRVALISAQPGIENEAGRFGAELARQLGAELVTWPGAEESGRHAPGDAVLDWLRRTDPGAAVVDLGAGPLRGLDQLRALVAAANCPVLVLGAGGTTT